MLGIYNIASSCWHHWEFTQVR